MKILSRFHLLPVLALVVVSLGLQLNAQQGQASQSQDDQQQQQPQGRPSSPDAQPPSQSAPDPQSQAPTDQPGGQVFTGTIVKSGSRYMLQDSDSGKMYDIDRQDLAQNHEGKQVRVPGTLDADGKTIHVGK
jgi:hemolysin activation/secretion protein